MGDTKMQHECNINATLMQHECNTNAAWMQHQCNMNATSVQHECKTSAICSHDIQHNAQTHKEKLPVDDPKLQTNDTEFQMNGVKL